MGQGSSYLFKRQRNNRSPSIMMRFGYINSARINCSDQATNTSLDESALFTPAIDLLVDEFSHRAGTLPRTRIYRTKINSIISNDNFGSLLFLLSPGRALYQAVQIRIIKLHFIQIIKIRATGTWRISRYSRLQNSAGFLFIFN